MSFICKIITGWCPVFRNRYLSGKTVFLLVKRLKNRYSVCKNITKSAGVESLFYNVESPETALASIDGNAGMALGNAYGSNICNIVLILGVSALINPIRVHSTVLRKELPILTLVTILTVVLLADLDLSRLDAVVLLLVFTGLTA
jgi:hypothetical protein